MFENYPPDLEVVLDIIEHWKDGKVFIASSDITGKYWSGSIWVFASAKDIPHANRCLAGLDTESGIGDAIVYGINDLIIGLDSGSIQLYDREEDPSVLCERQTLIGHDSYISSLSLSQDNGSLVSGSHDLCIKTWDMATATATNTYKPAHSRIINCVTYSPHEATVFLSSAKDHTLVLWDTRKPKPASSIRRNDSKNSIATILWAPESQEGIYLGDEGGNIFYHDLRDPQTKLFQIQAFEGKEIHKMCFCPTKCNILVACANDTKVVGIDTTSNKICYEDDRHQDFVKGLSWDTKAELELFSCGWDREVYLHNFNNM